MFYRGRSTSAHSCCCMTLAACRENVFDQTLSSVEVFEKTSCPIPQAFRKHCNECEVINAALCSKFLYLDFVNEKRLDQSHKCVIEVLRTHYLHQVPLAKGPLQLDCDTEENVAISSSNIVLQLLRNKTNGFFVECGAFDGEHGSYTLHLEQNYNWSGVLVEAYPYNFEILYARNRKVWTLPVCLSVRSYPLQINNIDFLSSNDKQISLKFGLLQQAHFLALENAQHSHIVYPEKSIGGNESIDASHVINVQCFPLFSILKAVGTTRIDFLRLSVAGYEIDILRTIPWHKVMILNLKRSSFHNAQVKHLLSLNGYLETREFDSISSENDVVYIHKDILTL